VIYVTLGTMYLDFPRLIRKMDEIAARTGERIIIQTGLAKTLPDHCEHFTFRPREDVLEIQRGARLVVAHAGIGAVMDALKAGKPLIVVPRLKKFREHNTDHQLDLAEAVQQRGWGRVIFDINELDAACANPPPPHLGYKPDRDRLIATLRAMIFDSVPQ
jgi:beta-1,4-N-acetylglucosaminyltransferase